MADNELQRTFWYICKIAIFVFLTSYIFCPKSTPSNLMIDRN